MSLFKDIKTYIFGRTLYFPGCVTKYQLEKVKNNYLAILKELGIDRKEKLTIIPYLDKPIIEEEPIYNLISTHDFRKTFYTNLSLLNVPESTIDLVTHPSKSIAKMSQTYNKSTLLDRARKFYNETKVKCEKESMYFFD